MQMSSDVRLHFHSIPFLLCALMIVKSIQHLTYTQAPDHCLQCEDGTRHYAHMRDHPSCRYYGKHWVSKRQRNPLLQILRAKPLKIVTPRPEIAFFMAEIQDSLCQKTANGTEFATKCKQLWKALPDAEKQNHVDKSLQDKARFEADMLRAYSGTADMRWVFVTDKQIHTETSSMLDDCITALCTEKAQQITVLSPATRTQLLQVHDEIETLEEEIVVKCAADAKLRRLRKRYGVAGYLHYLRMHTLSLLKYCSIAPSPTFACTGT